MLMKISLCQIHLEAGSVQQNLIRARQALAEAIRQGGQLALLPELWASGYDLSQASHLATFTPEILAELVEISHQANLAIGGSLLESATEGIFNTFSLVQPATPTISYRKIHLFRLMDEHLWLSPGHQAVMAPIADYQAGLSICYDLRFPELYRTYALHGANLFLISAEWPLRRIEHWNTLLRARAIENQAFLAAVNTVGKDRGFTYGGSSAVISPWGETLLQAPFDAEAVLTVELDDSQMDAVRNHMPVFSDRRPDVYKKPPVNHPNET
jgi:omega-amidase